MSVAYSDIVSKRTTFMKVQHNLLLDFLTIYFYTLSNLHVKKKRMLYLFNSNRMLDSRSVGNFRTKVCWGLIKVVNLKPRKFVDRIFWCC